jgi:cytochrome c oxidase assembly protein subunit 11
LLIFAVVQGVALLLLAVPIYRALTDEESHEQVVPDGPADDYGDTRVDQSREVTVHLTTSVHEELPWAFEVETPEVTVHPGERKVVKFRARNLTDATVRGKAIYDIAPPQAGGFYKKLECFCFSQQTLGPHEEAEMPVQFWIDPELPDDVEEVTVNYRFFNMESSVRGTAQR